MLHSHKTLGGLIWGVILGFISAFAFLALAWAVSLGMFVSLIYEVLEWVFGEYPTTGLFVSAGMVGGIIGAVKGFQNSRP